MSRNQCNTGNKLHAVDMSNWIIYFNYSKLEAHAHVSNLLCSTLGRVNSTFELYIRFHACMFRMSRTYYVVLWDVSTVLSGCTFASMHACFACVVLTVHAYFHACMFHSYARECTSITADEMWFRILMRACKCYCGSCIHATNIYQMLMLMKYQSIVSSLRTCQQIQCTSWKLLRAWKFYCGSSMMQIHAFY